MPVYNMDSGNVNGLRLLKSCCVFGQTSATAGIPVHPLTRRAPWPILAWLGDRYSPMTENGGNHVT